MSNRTGWGLLHWGEAEFLEELAFLNWCHETCGPESVNLWLLACIEKAKR